VPENEINPIQSFKGIYIDDSVLTTFLEYCKKRIVPKKHLLIRKGEPADTLYFLIKGNAMVIMEDEDDTENEIILAYLDAGEFIGEIGLFFETSYRQTLVRARTECVLAEIKYKQLQLLFQNELADHRAEFLTLIGRQLSLRLMHTSRKVGELAFLDVTGRVANSLLELSQSTTAISHPKGIQVHVSRSEIARNVGCSREMVGRVIKNMALEGIIEANGMDIVILKRR
jgi:CRP/FNR family cyclic AMP-dependent transcriptional regulator